MAKEKTYTLVLTEAEVDTIYDAIRVFYDFVDDEEALKKVQDLEQKVYEETK